MGDRTGISWTDATWNPVRGCSRVSAGCDSCYAIREAHRMDHPGGAYEGLTRLRNASIDWSGVVHFVPGKLDLPLRWRKPRRIFVASMSDPFHPSLAFEQIAAIFGVMAAAQRHTFQLLTKRPERALEWFEWVTNAKINDAFRDIAPSKHEGKAVLPTQRHGMVPGIWPLSNVHLGVSVEDQVTADERIPLLLRCPAALRWISLEPQIAEVDLDRPRCDTCGEAADSVADDGATPWCSEHDEECSYGHWLDPLNETDCGNGGIAWVVQGGESGPRARPFDLAWARKIRDQCKAAGTPYFLKQLGDLSTDHVDGTPLEPLRARGGSDPSEWPLDLRVQEFP